VGSARLCQTLAAGSSWPEIQLLLPLTQQSGASLDLSAVNYSSALVTPQQQLHVSKKQQDCLHHFSILKTNSNPWADGGKPT
jgi:hypothetical protein